MKNDSNENDIEENLEDEEGMMIIFV